MPKHTPGPWRWVHHEHYTSLETAIPNPRLNDPVIFALRDDWRCFIRTPTKKNEADAALIAAAPELLEALKLAYRHIKTHGTDPDDELGLTYTDEAWAALEAIKPVLAKAGEPTD